MTQSLDAHVDALGRRTEYVYDTSGYVTSVTVLAGTPDAVTSSVTYQEPFHEVASTTDALGNATSYGYDGSGNVSSVTDPLANQSTFTHDTSGRVVIATNPEGDTTTFSYHGPDLVEVTDPVGNTSTVFYDVVGRGVIETASGGADTLVAYGPLNTITAVTDPEGGITTYSYDGNGNLASLVDAGGGEIAYTHDVMDQMATRSDQHDATETFTYDLVGNVVGHVGRDGVVTEYGYDDLGRLTFTGFGSNGAGVYTSTVDYFYDAGSQLTQVDDSESGTITLTYDSFGRVASETTPTGTVTYTYDAEGRTLSMTAGDDPTVSYTYDDAGRVTTIARGGDTVVYGYDGASRLTSRTLPLGVDAQYVYNAASLVTSIAYSQGAATIGDITYSYDSDGLRNSVGGSLAATVLPDPVSSVSYDVANRVTDWDGTPVAHDVNGNMTSFGEITYQWDDRGRLAVVDDPARDTTFGYDGFGRRSDVTVDGAAAALLYGGSGVVQRLDDTGTVASSWLHGTGVDDHLAMYDDAGTGVYLTDALGSTVAMVDETGVITTSYGYTPFGDATVSGVGSDNPYTFTGRVDDGTGLLYYRARYLHPEVGRFISEDPIGMAGGVNLYTYVGNNPTNATDPTGMLPAWIGPALLGGFHTSSFGSVLTGRKDSQHWLGRLFEGAIDNRGVVATWVAAGTCVAFSIGVCAGVVGAAFLVRSDESIRELGWVDARRAVLADAFITATTFSLFTAPLIYGTEGLTGATLASARATGGFGSLAILQVDTIRGVGR